jgi:uncharacterized membrane protein YfcA
VKTTIPHLRIVVAVSAFVLTTFAAVSAWVLLYSDDEVTKGNIIGTWQNFALLAVGFWLGSSSGGKAKEPTEPTPVTVENDPSKPVPVEENN